jgi:site-specific DNA-methyltransferase (adenine-specific)
MKITDKLTITNEDNMVLMARYPDNYFDLAIVDPPYGLGDRLSNGGGKRKEDPSRLLYVDKEWDDLPSAEYWKELFRVSKNQVVFGANYFLEYLPNTRGFVCWDKKQKWLRHRKTLLFFLYIQSQLLRRRPQSLPNYIFGQFS